MNADGLQALVIVVLLLAGIFGALWVIVRCTMPGQEKILTDAFRRKGVRG